MVHDIFFVLSLDILNVDCSNLLATCNHKSSIITQPPTPHVNPAVLPFAILALVIGIFFSYIPVLCVHCLT